MNVHTCERSGGPKPEASSHLNGLSGKSLSKACAGGATEVSPGQRPGKRRRVLPQPRRGGRNFPDAPLNTPVALPRPEAVLVLEAGPTRPHGGATATRP